MADHYPHDLPYFSIIEGLRQSVATDRISMGWWHGGAQMTRQQLCELLTSRHNSRTNPTQTQANAAYLGQTITVNDCLLALTYISGYSSAAGWAAWAGHHRGAWFGEDQRFDDNARWSPPTTRVRTMSMGRGHPAGRRIFDYQPVEFLDRTGDARHGWNQSLPTLPFVTGWDPKTVPNNHGLVGSNIGFTFQVGATSCIIWLTRKEAFLECIRRTSQTNRRRSSTGLYGFGQWDVT